MKKIALDELINMADSRYSLVTIISKRARQIIDGSQVLVKTNTTKPVAVAIEEFYEGKYQAIYDYDQYKKNLQETSEGEAQDSPESEVQDSEDENGNENAEGKETEEEQPNE